jgi:predicted transcriptional regulator
MADVPEDYDKYKVVFSNPLIPKILIELFKDDSIAISKIGEKLDVYSGTIQYHIKKLKSLDLVRSTKNKNGDIIQLVNVELLKEYNQFFKEPDFSNILKGL